MWRDGCLLNVQSAAILPHYTKVLPIISLPPTLFPQDVDSYIHRCGRTGRAGRTGVNILFYKLQQERLVQAVEQKAGFSFQRIGAPQPIDIVKAGAKDAARSGGGARGVV